MTENMISFNFTNWVTVVVMALVGLAIVSVAAQGVRAVRASQQA